MRRPSAEAEDDHGRTREKRSRFPRSLEVSRRGRATLDLSLGQKKLLLHALAELNGAQKIPKGGETKPIETTPVTVKTLASDAGLEELQAGGVSLDDPLVTLGATEQPLSVPLERVDNNPLGVQDNKGGETNLSLTFHTNSLGVSWEHRVWS